jgi:hypothetical protein
MPKKKKKRDSAGLPPKYDNAEQLQSAIDKYFKYNEEEKRYTVAGLAHGLGFKSRQSMYDYEGMNNRYSYIIKRARLKIEERLETLMYYEKNINVGGIALGMKTHYGYTDRMVDKGDNKDLADVDVPERPTREQWEKANKDK